MVFDRKSFKRKLTEGWNNYAVRELLELYSGDVFYIHQGRATYS